jgi:hypothetical protein
MYKYLIYMYLLINEIRAEKESKRSVLSEKAPTIDQP